MAQGNQAKHWCATVHNYCCVEVPERLEAALVRGVFGEELGEESSPHLQVAVEFKAKKRLTAIRALCLGTCWENAHWEIARGSPKDNYEYCTKEGLFWTFGDWSNVHGEGAGTQDEWHQAYQLAQGGGVPAVAALFPQIAIRNYSALQQIHAQALRESTTLRSLPGVCGLWVFGRAGSGKSHLAHSFGELCKAVAHSPRLDNYSGQSVILYDDLDKSAAQKDHLTQMLKQAADKYPFAVQKIYQGAVLIRPKMCVVTSQYEIREIWPDFQTREALDRRYDTVKVETMLVNGQTTWLYTHTHCVSKLTSLWNNLEELTSFLKCRFHLVDLSAASPDGGAVVPPPHPPDSDDDAGGGDDAASSA